MNSLKPLTRVVLILAVSALVVMSLFPPWVYTSSGRGLRLGFHFFLTPPELGGAIPRVDVVQLLLQVLVLSAVTGLALLAACPIQRGYSEFSRTLLSTLSEDRKKTIRRFLGPTIVTLVSVLFFVVNLILVSSRHAEVREIGLVLTISEFYYVLTSIVIWRECAKVGMNRAGWMAINLFLPVLGLIWFGITRHQKLKVTCGTETPPDALPVSAAGSPAETQSPGADGIPAEMKTHESFRPLDPYVHAGFAGTRWGMRLLLFFLVGGVLFTMGSFTINTGIPNSVIILLSALGVALALRLLQLVIQNWFRTRHHQYGFLAIMFLVLAFGSSGQHRIAQSQLDSYTKSSEFIAKRQQIADQVGRGELKFATDVEAAQYVLRELPQFAGLVRSVWIPNYVLGTCSWLWVGYLLAFIVTRQRYRRSIPAELRRTTKQQGP